MHAVLDTNIVIDLLHFADPTARTLREAIDRGELTCFTDQPCLAELERAGRLLEAQRMKQRTRFDLEMLEATGSCAGIAN